MKLYKSAWLNDPLIFCLIHVKTGLCHEIHDIKIHGMPDIINFNEMHMAQSMRPSLKC